MIKGVMLLGVLGTSFSALLVRWSQAPSLVLVVYRMTFATLLLLPALWSRREELSRLTGRQWGLCFLSGAFLGLHFFAYFAALGETSVAAAVVLVDTEVFWVAAALWILRGETPGRRGILGIALAFAGSVLVALSGGLGGSLRGCLIALAGAALMAVYTVIGRLLREELSTTVYTALVYGAGCAVTAALTLVSGEGLTGHGGRELLIGLGLAVFCTLLGHSVFSWGLKYEKASYISTVKFLEPVFAAVLAALAFGELPTLATVLGGAVILLGVGCYSAGESAQKGD